MLRTEIKSGITHVGLALREPEEFAIRWNQGLVNYRWWVWMSLLATAILGTTTYGMVMGLLGGASQVFYKGLACTASTGMAWLLSLPTLYILNSLAGSRLSASSTFLAALITVSWGGLAMIASIPISWFFTTAIPHSTFILVVHLTVFTGVGVAMTDTFQRVMRSLEPQRGAAAVWWLLLVGAIGIELFVYSGLFYFNAV